MPNSDQNRGFDCPVLDAGTAPNTDSVHSHVRLAMCPMCACGASPGMLRSSADPESLTASASLSALRGARMYGRGEMRGVGPAT